MIVAEIRPAASRQRSPDQSGRALDESVEVRERLAPHVNRLEMEGR
jgi:hypothetical protein